MVNDDRSDNRFHDNVGRFPDIEEDAEPLYSLGNEYHLAKSKQKTLEERMAGYTDDCKCKEWETGVSKGNEVL